MNYKVILILIMLMIFPNIVYASENVYSECNENECVLYGETDYNILAIEISFSIENNLDYTFTKDDSWEGSGEDYLISLYTDEYKIGKYVLGTLKFEDNVESDDIKYLSIMLCDENFEEVIVDVNNINNVNNETKSVNIMSIIFILLIIFVILIIGIIVMKKRSSKK